MFFGIVRIFVIRKDNGVILLKLFKLVNFILFRVKREREKIYLSSVIMVKIVE